MWTWKFSLYCTLVNRRKIEILKQIEVYDLEFLVILNMAMKMDQMVQMNMWNF